MTAVAEPYELPQAEEPEVSSVAPPAIAIPLPAGAIVKSTPPPPPADTSATADADPHEPLDDRIATDTVPPAPAVPTRVAEADQASAAVAPQPDPTPSSPIPEAQAETPEASSAAPPAPPPSGEVPKSTPPGIPAAEWPPASELSRRRSRTKLLAFVLLPVAVLAAGAFVYQLGVRAGQRAAARAAVTTAGREPTPPASTGSTMGPVADSSGDSPKPEPAPPHSSSAPAPVAKVEAARRPAGRAPSAARASMGILDTTHLPAGRRIVVDGRVVGASPRRASVRCGAHSVRIGALPTESIEVPCGGEVIFDDD